MEEEIPSRPQLLHGLLDAIDVNSDPQTGTCKLLTLNPKEVSSRSVFASEAVGWNIRALKQQCGYGEGCVAV